MKIFLCFSSQDRYTVVNSFLYHLKKYNVPIWYDYHELTLGDNRIHGNFNLGLNLCNYALVIISPNMFDCKCGNDELTAIKARHEQNTIHIFPIFYKIKAHNLPNKYQWLTSLIYNEIDEDTGTLSACNQIVYQIVKDGLALYDIKRLDSHMECFDKYISKAIYTYEQTDIDNFNSRFTILYMIYLYLCSKQVAISDMHHHILDRMYRINQLNIAFPHKEMLIAETIITIILNDYNLFSK